MGPTEICTWIAGITVLRLCGTSPAAITNELFEQDSVNQFMLLRLRNGKFL